MVYFDIKIILFDKVISESVLSRVSNFIGNGREIAKVIYKNVKCQSANEDVTNILYLIQLN